MAHSTGRIVKVLAAAAVVAVAAVSCPSPIDRDLLLVVGDNKPASGRRSRPL